MKSQSDKRKLIVGKYQLISKIGAGAMGEVYEGRHLVTEERVAVKLLTREVNDSEVWLQRFNREATAASKIGHPGITKIHDAGFDEAQGRYYLAMEFLEGETFGARVSDGRISIGHSLLVIYELLDALSAAHSSSVIHRDVKPENIFIETLRDGTERVKLLDFGIAKEQNKPSATMGEVSIGTPYYMSPEQARATASITYRTDIWSVGVILYWLVAGHPPFMGESSYDIVLKACATPHKSIAPKNGIPPRLIELIETCLEKDPSKRSLDALALRDALESLIADDVTWKKLTKTPTNLSVLFVSPRAASASPRFTKKALSGEENNQASSTLPRAESNQGGKPGASTGDLREEGNDPVMTASDRGHGGSSENLVLIPTAKPIPRRESALQRPSSLPTQTPLPIPDDLPTYSPKKTRAWGLVGAFVVAALLGAGYHRLSSQEVTSEPVELKETEAKVISKEQAEPPKQETRPNTTDESEQRGSTDKPALKTIKVTKSKSQEAPPATGNPKLKRPAAAKRKKMKSKSSPALNQQAMPSPNPNSPKADTVAKVSLTEEKSEDVQNLEVSEPSENTEQAKEEVAKSAEPQIPQDKSETSESDLNKDSGLANKKDQVTKSTNPVKKSVTKPKREEKKEEKKDEPAEQEEFFSF